MNQGKRLSVIIPGYNNPRKYWERCLKSVLMNIADDDEIICVDDGSVQRPEFLEDCAKSDGRISVIFLEKNVGLPSARNVALARTNGRFVTFVDSDDELLEGIYAKTLSALNASGADIAVFGVRSVWVAEKLSKICLPNKEAYGELSAPDIKWLYENSLLNYAWNKVFRRSLLARNDLRFAADGVPCEDIIFVLNCILAKPKWIGIPQVGINYYRAHNTLLSRYKATYVRGTHMANEAWKRVGCAIDKAGVLTQTGKVSDIDIIRGEWDNIWRMGSPVSFTERFRFAERHPELHFGSVYVFFVKRLVYAFLRKWFYVTAVQRWHISRTYKGAERI